MTALLLTSTLPDVIILGEPIVVALYGSEYSVYPFFVALSDSLHFVPFIFFLISIIQKGDAEKSKEEKDGKDEKDGKGAIEMCEIDECKVDQLIKNGDGIDGGADNDETASIVSSHAHPDSTDETRVTLKDHIIANLVKNPLLWGVCVGSVIGIFHLPLPGPIEGFLIFMGHIATDTTLFSLGAFVYVSLDFPSYMYIHT
jgi:predicted permease